MMIMARILIGAVCLLAIVPLRGADLDPDRIDLDKLRKEQRELAVSLHKKRVELLEKDGALKELHKKIMAMHRELALRLDNHRELRDLAKRMREIEIKIRRREEELGIRKKPDKDTVPGIIETDKGD
jgi:hypothetical protein